MLRIQSHVFWCFLFFWRTIVFVGLRNPCYGFLVTSGLDFKARYPRLHALSPVCNRILRFTYGGTPADLLVANMVAKLDRSTYLCTSIGGARVRDIARNSMFVLVYVYIKTQNKMKTVKIFPTAITVNQTNQLFLDIIY